MNHKQSTTDAIKTFLDIFGGTNGAGDFIKVRFKLEGLAELADSGDANAAQIIERLLAIERLFKYIVKESRPIAL